MFKHLKTYGGRGGIKAGFPVSHVFLSDHNSTSCRSQECIQGGVHEKTCLSHEIPVFNSLKQSSNILEDYHVQSWPKDFWGSFKFWYSNRFVLSKQSHLLICCVSIIQMQCVRQRRGYKINTMRVYCPERAFGWTSGRCGIWEQWWAENRNERHWI